ncbi:hypothetical protein ABIE26_000195 [Pedobacter africanus]|uniref:Uncharacterized protein n=1 Tax=Pedobacter africanus TaxID=151894 RepID=A0ACC6KVX1_9SPHI|nr:hypothetical protein [Pedobacter africanus]MDR6783317.1 hypothetical protein [Pedobacter africanus]
MKKSFLTLALLATLAVGAATAQVYAPLGTTPLPCDPGFFTCAMYAGTTEGYSDAYPNQGDHNRVDLIEYSLNF